MFALEKVYTEKIEEDQRIRTIANLPFILLEVAFSHCHRPIPSREYDRRGFG